MLICVYIYTFNDVWYVCSVYIYTFNAIIIYIDTHLMMLMCIYIYIYIYIHLMLYLYIYIYTYLMMFDMCIYIYVLYIKCASILPKGCLSTRNQRLFFSSWSISGIRPCWPRCRMHLELGKFVNWSRWALEDHPRGRRRFAPEKQVNQWW